LDTNRTEGDPDGRPATQTAWRCGVYSSGGWLGYRGLRVPQIARTTDDAVSRTLAETAGRRAGSRPARSSVASCSRGGKKKKQKPLKPCGYWCARLGSNQQPLPSEGSTLSI